MVYISGETQVYTVSTPTLEITPDQLSLYDTYYFNVVSVDNIGRSGNHSDNSALLSISKICWLFSIVSTVYIINSIL